MISRLSRLKEVIPNGQSLSLCVSASGCVCVNDIPCNFCVTFCFIKRYKLSHMRCHRVTVPANYEMSLNTISLCPICRKVCKSCVEPKRHANIHKNKPNDNKMCVSRVCQLCANSLLLPSLKKETRVWCRWDVKRQVSTMAAWRNLPTH